MSGETKVGVQKLVKLSSVVSHGGGAVRGATERNAFRGFREEITRINNPEVRGVQ